MDSRVLMAAAVVVALLVGLGVGYALALRDLRGAQEQAVAGLSGF